MKITFVDLYAQYLTIKPGIDAAPLPQRAPIGMNDPLPVGPPPK